MTEEDHKSFKAATKCHICEEEFINKAGFSFESTKLDIEACEYIIKQDISELDNEAKKTAKKAIKQAKEDKKSTIKDRLALKVRDHDHYNGEYRGAAHLSCNLNYHFKNYRTPIFFHNLRRYDEHFIVPAAGKYERTYFERRR